MVITQTKSRILTADWELHVPKPTATDTSEPYLVLTAIRINPNDSEDIRSKTIRLSPDEARELKLIILLEQSSAL